MGGFVFGSKLKRSTGTYQLRVGNKAMYIHIYVLKPSINSFYISYGYMQYILVYR